MLAARRVGTQHASNATIANRSPAPSRVIGSVASTSNRNTAQHARQNHRRRDPRDEATSDQPGTPRRRSGGEYPDAERRPRIESRSRDAATPPRATAPRRSRPRSRRFRRMANPTSNCVTNVRDAHGIVANLLERQTVTVQEKRRGATGTRRRIWAALPGSRDPRGGQRSSTAPTRSPSCAGVKSLPSTVAARRPSRSMTAVCSECVISPSSAQY